MSDPAESEDVHPPGIGKWVESLKNHDAAICPIWEKMRSSYWLVSALVSIAAVILVVLLFLVDRKVKEKCLSFLPDLYVMDAPGARTILPTLASSTITVAGVVFSIAMLDSPMPS